MLFWIEHIIVDHLDGFCVLEYNALPLNHRLHEVLMD
jgi:hypothetical protein